MEKQIFVDFIDRGLSTWKMADELNITQPAVRYWLKKYNLKTRKVMCDSEGCKYCPKCKTVKDRAEFYSSTKSSSYCKSCIVLNLAEKRQEAKKRAVEYLGGKCICCGYNKSLAALEFHHLDPGQKDPDYYSLKTNFEKLKSELDKCALLCANCHREEHSLYLTSAE